MSSTEQTSTFLSGSAVDIPRQGASPLGGGDGAASAGSGTAAAEPQRVRLRRLAGVAVWALALVLAGSASAIVGLFHIFGDGPGWFTPAFITTGVVGMLLTMMAFATLRFKGVPWMFMGAASVTLLAAFAMLSMA
ncbi:hypothetical protein [Glycomyces tenuis]|uniref:hypothetical protein n=1 Tax=Glycomyces tenuis TaxID=58116 RepID=UPI00047C81A4|nr:hypothetical protein [Glycomyces tenuis]